MILQIEFLSSKEEFEIKKQVQLERQTVLSVFVSRTFPSRDQAKAKLVTMSLEGVHLRIGRAVRLTLSERFK